MDWNKFKKNAAGMALKATAAMSDEMGKRSESLSREKGLSSEKREELRRKADSYRDGARQINQYYNENFSKSQDRDQEDEE